VLKRLPREGESFVEQDWRFEVVDMDGRKIDKLLASQQRRRREEPASPEE
jgi:putative hemolysin